MYVCAAQMEILVESCVDPLVNADLSVGKEGYIVTLVEGTHVDNWGSGGVGH